MSATPSFKTKDWLHWVLVLISAATAVSGLVQMVVPGFVLSIVGAATDATSSHFFAIVGMFMFLFGGLMLQVLLSPSHHPVAVFWAGLQKLGAAGAVALGVWGGIFGAISWLVAGFDLLSGVLIFIYWKRITGPK